MSVPVWSCALLERLDVLGQGGGLELERCLLAKDPVPGQHGENQPNAETENDHEHDRHRLPQKRDQGNVHHLDQYSPTRRPSPLDVQLVQVSRDLVLRQELVDQHPRSQECEHEAHSQPVGEAELKHKIQHDTHLWAPFDLRSLPMRNL